MLDLTEDVLKQFGFSRFEINLSTKPEKAVGSDEIWDKATTALREALEDKGWDYGIDEGGGAFYGPKIDIKIEDAIGRKWQCSTIQVLSNLCTDSFCVFQGANAAALILFFYFRTLGLIVWSVPHVTHIIAVVLWARVAAELNSLLPS